ncbi:MAG: flagellar hook-associated protein FlgK [Rubellimicrobium sp.]|nr:flagellar hook-associated protein FlgK [Rubellimicrobium sp.]
MSLTQSVANALSGLTAASRMAQTVSANLANALTDGYGRRVVDLSAQVNGLAGAGVRVDGITRIIDRAILADRRDAESQHQGSSLTATALLRVERAMGDADAGTSLAAQVTALQAALAAAGADPSSDIALARVLDRLAGLAGGLRHASDAVQAERLDADRSIAADVDLLNRSLRALERVNDDIVTARITGNDPSGLMDQRQTLIDTIARIVPVREMARPDGRVALVTPGGEMLIDGRARQYEFAAAGVVTADMTLASGGLSGLMRDGQPVSGPAGTGWLDGGTLGAAFRLRDDILPAQSDALDRLAADLIARFASPAADPTLGAADPGLFTDAGAAFDPLAAAGLAGRIAVNATVDPARGGALWHLRDGIGAAAPGPVGAAGQLARWADALDTTSTSGPGSAAGSFGDHAARLSASAANARLMADEAQARSGARWRALREAELATGVDSDHELQMLLDIERAYAANARTLATIDAMFRTLLEI